MSNEFVARAFAQDPTNEISNLNDQIGILSGSISDITTKKYLNKWFSGGIKGKKIVLVGDSTTDYAYGLHRALSYYTRRGGELESVALLNYGYNGQQLAYWNTDSGRYGKASTIAQQADLYIFCYGINDCRQSALTEDQFTSLLEQAIDDIQAGSPNSTILLRVPNTFTTSNTGSYNFVSPETPDASQAISTLLRNAYLRAANSRGVALVDAQSLVYGLTSNADVNSPLMLNQIHPNDAGNHILAREIVKMIGVPATIPPVTFTMDGLVGIGTLGTKVLANGGTFKLGYIDYLPSMNSGSITIEFRKIPVGGGAYTVLGTATYSGGTGAGNTMSPNAALLNPITFAAGDSLQVAVTACTVITYNLTVYTIIDENPKVALYPLMLRGNGLVSALDGSVVYSASQGLPTTMERDILGLKAMRFKPLNTNRFINWSQDATQSSWVVNNATVTGTPGNQVITATATNSIAALNAPVTQGETLTFSWKATNTGSPKYAVYDASNGAFIIPSTTWPAADGNGWRSVTFTVPTGSTQIRCYPLSASVAVGDTITLTGMQLTPGSSMGTYYPTNGVGTSLVVNTGAIPQNFTMIQFVKVDNSTGISVASTGVNTDGNPAFESVNGNNFGYPVIPTRGIATRGSTGTWQSAILRATGGNVYVTLNDQPTSVPFSKTVNRTDLRWNLVNDGDTTGTYQNWDGEVIAFYFPYLLTEGQAMAFVRSKLRTLQAAGESITGDWASERLV